MDNDGVARSAVDLQQKLEGNREAMSFFDDMADAAGISSADRGVEMSRGAGKGQERLMHYEFHPIIAIRCDERGAIYRELDSAAPDYFNAASAAASRQEAAAWGAVVYKQFKKFGDVAFNLPIKGVSRLSPRQLLIQIKEAVTASYAKEASFNSKVSG